ncbi:DUF3995 domain-containing protein [Motilibacter aurantiacus]|uniref:DUF3995 domain-containing protein n=1 Tax=Motilibacter aurantiacus TaxID=2714955 RepID=UPI0014080A58|nr:DUF3995 domain-containing protein [Motilibacter aurantiacus]
MTAPAPAAATTAAALVATAGVHLAWAAGSPWPFADHDTWRRSILDAKMAEPRPADYAAVVAALLAGSGAMLAAGGAAVPGWRRLPRPLRTAAPWGVVGALALRGGLGLLLVDPARHGEDFTRLNRRVYSPLCLALAAGAGWTAARRRDQA